MNFRIYYTNFQYFAQGSFSTLEAAIAYGKSKCFEFSVWNEEDRLYSWSPLYGSTFYKNAPQNSLAVRP